MPGVDWCDLVVDLTDLTNFYQTMYVRHYTESETYDDVYGAEFPERLQEMYRLLPVEPMPTATMQNDSYNA